MSKLLELSKVLSLLEIHPKQDGEYLRFYCPLKHPTTDSRPSGAIHTSGKGYKCFKCGFTAPDIGGLVSELWAEQTYYNKPTTKTDEAWNYLLTIQEDQSIT